MGECSGRVRSPGYLLGVDEGQVGGVLGKEEGVGGRIERVPAEHELAVGVRLRPEQAEVAEEDVWRAVDAVVGRGQVRHRVVLVLDAPLPQSLVEAGRRRLCTAESRRIRTG